MFFVNAVTGCVVLFVYRCILFISLSPLFSIVCPKILMHHILTFFDKNTHTCELKLMKGKISMISSLTYYHFSHEKIHRKEKRFLTEICNGECLHLFFHLEVTRNTSHDLSMLSSGYFQSLAMEIDFLFIAMY